jgi:hypothetical protein
MLPIALEEATGQLFVTDNKQSTIFKGSLRFVESVAVDASERKLAVGDMGEGAQAVHIFAAFEVVRMGRGGKEGWEWQQVKIFISEGGAALPSALTLSRAHSSSRMSRWIYS